jgi:hypothetical protein
MAMSSLTVQNIRYSQQNLTSYLNTAVTGSTGHLSAVKFGRQVTLFFKLLGGTSSAFKNNAVVTNALPETLRPQASLDTAQGITVGSAINYNPTNPVSTTEYQSLASWHLEGAVGSLHIQQWGAGETAYPGSYCDWSVSYIADNDNPLSTIIA